jgi:hypothetical protein
MGVQGDIEPYHPVLYGESTVLVTEKQLNLYDKCLLLSQKREVSNCQTEIIESVWKVTVLLSQKGFTFIGTLNEKSVLLSEK